MNLRKCCRKLYWGRKNDNQIDKDSLHRIGRLSEPPQNAEPSKSQKNRIIAGPENGGPSIDLNSNFKGGTNNGGRSDLISK